VDLICEITHERLRDKAGHGDRPGNKAVVHNFFNNAEVIMESGGTASGSSRTQLSDKDVTAGHRPTHDERLGEVPHPKRF